jgi:hypothetical protein
MSSVAQTMTPAAMTSPRLEISSSPNFITSLEDIQSKFLRRWANGSASRRLPSFWGYLPARLALQKHS